MIMPRVRKTANHQTARVSLPVHAGSSQGGRDYDSDRFTTTTLRKRVLASCFSVMESTIGAFPSTEKPDSRLCHVCSSKNSDGPTKEAVGAIRHMVPQDGVRVQETIWQDALTATSENRQL